MNVRKSSRRLMSVRATVRAQTPKEADIDVAITKTLPGLVALSLNPPASAPVGVKPVPVPAPTLNKRKSTPKRRIVPTSQMGIFGRLSALAFGDGGDSGGGDPGPDDGATSMNVDEANDFRGNGTGGKDVDGGDVDDSDDDDVPLSSLAEQAGAERKRRGDDLTGAARRLKQSSDDALSAATDLDQASGAAACMAQNAYGAMVTARGARAKVKTAEEALQEAESKRTFYDTAVQSLDDIISRWPTGQTKEDRRAAVQLAEGDKYRDEIKAARTRVQTAGTQWLKAAKAYRNHKTEELLNDVRAQKTEKGKKTYENKDVARVRAPEMVAARKADDDAEAKDKAVVESVTEKFASVTTVLRQLTSTKNASMKADEALQAMGAAQTARDGLETARDQVQNTARAVAASTSVARQRSNDADAEKRRAVNTCGKASELVDSEVKNLKRDCKTAVDNLAMMRYELKTMMVQYDTYIQQAEMAIETQEAEEDEDKKCSPQDLAAMKEALRVAKETFEELELTAVEDTILRTMAKFEESAAGMKAKQWDEAMYNSLWEQEAANDEVSDEEPEDEEGEEDADEALEQLDAHSSIACTVVLKIANSRDGSSINLPLGVADESTKDLAKHLRRQIQREVLKGELRRTLPIEVAVDMPVEPHEMVVSIKLAETTKKGEETEWGQLLKGARGVVQHDESSEEAVQSAIGNATKKLDDFLKVPFFAEVAVPGADGESVKLLLSWINEHLKATHNQWFEARAEAMPDVFADMSEHEEVEFNAAYSSAWKSRVKNDAVFYEKVRMHLQRIRDRESKSSFLGGANAGLQNRLNTVIGTLEQAADPARNDKKAQRRFKEVHNLVETVKLSGMDGYVAGWTVKPRKKWYEEDGAVDADSKSVAPADKWTLLVRFLQSEDLDYESNGDAGDAGDAGDEE